MDGRISWLRIVACYLTILLHVTATQAELQTSGWKIAVLIDSLTRVCVPIFFMISGATLLSKSEPLMQFFHKRLVRIIPPLVFWSVIYLFGATFIVQVSRPLPSGIMDWTLSILKGPVIFHLWYLYAILGLYTAIPMLRRFYQNATQSEKLWALAMWFIAAACLPLLNSAMLPTVCGNFQPLKFEAVYQLSIYSNYLGYFLLGAVVAEGRWSRQAGVFAFTIGSLVTFAGVMWHSHIAHKACLIFLSYSSPFVVIAAAGLFAFIYSWKTTQTKLLEKTAQCTLGIYCIHYIFIREFFAKLDFITWNSSAWITAPLVALLTFVFSGLIIYGMRCTKLGRVVT